MKNHYLFVVGALFILLSVSSAAAASSSPSEISKLSHSEALDALRKWDAFNLSPSQVKEREQYYSVLAANNNLSSHFTRMLSVASLISLLRLILAFFVFLFVLFLIKDVAIALGIKFVGLLRKPIVAGPLGYSLSLLFAVYGKAPPTPALEPWWFLGEHFLIVGCLIFSLTSTYLFVMYPGYSRATNADLIVLQLSTMFWTCVAALQQHNVTGIFAIMQLFWLVGFRFGSFFGGYYAGFEEVLKSVRCLVLAVVLNVVFFFFKELNLPDKVEIFRSGVEFWATFVGAIAVLILFDVDFVQWRIIYPMARNSSATWLGKTGDTILLIACVILGFVIFFALLSVGTIYNISNYRTIGAIFLAFQMLDIERILLWKSKSSSFTGLLFIGVITLWALIAYFKFMFPEVGATLSGH